MRLLSSGGFERRRFIIIVCFSGGKVFRMACSCAVKLSTEKVRITNSALVESIVTYLDQCGQISRLKYNEYMYICMYGTKVVCEH